MAVENIVIKYIADTSEMAAGKRALQDVAREEDNIRKSVEEATKSVREQGDAFHQASNKATAGTNQAAGGFANLNNLMKNGAQLVAGYFAVDNLLRFGSQVISITSEFQKLNAVLKNTLGSQSAADNAMKLIQNFAAKTPFSVAELTNSFVKLVNRGLIPTEVELKRLGDLAASQGKSFDQLAEAALDAMTGEFERLKEFGVQASKSGDNVAFTFKGVTTEVAYTDEAIRDYIVSLGEAEGVSGSMAAISETLGGKISNLGDSWDRLLVTLGNGSSGAMSRVVEGLSNTVNQLNDMVTVKDQLDKTEGVGFFEQLGVLFLKEGVNDEVDQLRKHLLDIANATKEVTKDTEEWNVKTESQLDKLKRLRDEAVKVRDALPQGTDAVEFNKLNIEIAEYEETIRRLTTVQREGGIHINPLPPETLKSIQLANVELKATNRELQEIEYNTNPANQDTNQREYFAGLIREWLEFNEEKVRIATDAAMQLGALASTLFQNDIMENEERLSSLDDYYAREIELAGDNSRAKGELEQDYLNKRAEIEREIAEQKRKQAILNKAMAIGDIAIQTAVSIARVMAEVPKFDFGASTGVLIALYSALGAAQIATVAAQKIPKYKDGVLNFQGKGTETSDSNLAFISRGESVMTARETREYMPLLKGIRNGEIPDWYLALAENGFQMPQLNTSLPEWAGSNTAVDLNPLISEMRQFKQALENQPQYQTIIDENGFNYYQQKGNTRTQYLNKRRAT